MSGSTEKKKRRAIRKYVEANKDIVLLEVIKTLQTGTFKEKFAFCIIVFFKGKK